MTKRAVAMLAFALGCAGQGSGPAAETTRTETVGDDEGAAPIATTELASTDAVEPAGAETTSEPGSATSDPTPSRRPPSVLPRALCGDPREAEVREQVTLPPCGAGLHAEYVVANTSAGDVFFVAWEAPRSDDAPSDLPFSTGGGTVGGADLEGAVPSTEDDREALLVGAVLAETHALAPLLSSDGVPDDLRTHLESVPELGYAVVDGVSTLRAITDTTSASFEDTTRVVARWDATFEDDGSVSVVRTPLFEVHDGVVSVAPADEVPPRSAIVAAFAEPALRAAVDACAEGPEEHRVVVLVLFAGTTGTVRSATVIGDAAGTPLGTCVARAVRSATVPPFWRTTYSVNYPLTLPAR